MEEKIAVVVFSGGQDSTTCLLKALKEYDKVYAISFFYAQKHWNELEKAKQICDDFNVEHKIVHVENIFDCLTNCSLVNTDLEIKKEEGEAYPNSCVDGRNHIFLSIASIWAKQLGAHDIITGCCETDFSGYPDCRRVFIDSLQQTMSLGMDYQINIITPLMYLDKKQTWAMADELGYLEYVRDNTHTCYNGVEGGCHECPSCKLRERGLQQYLEEKQAKEVANV